MFWKVAGFSQPSPIEQILEKEQFTLEELLDEDDIIQECKSLNGRLIAFLKEKSIVEQLLRYLVQPPVDSEDPKKQYKYPFTACEVFCCEVEAIFNTLLENEELMHLLFSLLDKQPPLDCKVAGYFGRVVGYLLIRKTGEMMQYLSKNEALIEKLVNHVDTTSIADVLKRLVGADDQSSMLFLPSHTQWLSDTNLVELLLARLDPKHSGDVQANTSDILCAISHSQPSSLSAKLMREESIASLFRHALVGDNQLLVPALDVCIALLEPRRSAQEAFGLDCGSPTPLSQLQTPQSEAIKSIISYVPRLVEYLGDHSSGHVQECPYGVLAPPLGRAKLKVTELLGALLRSGGEETDTAVREAKALELCLRLFEQYPFNNMLHHNVTRILLAVMLNRRTDVLLEHLLEDCRLLDWIIGLPKKVVPKPRAGCEELASAKDPLRAGYLGHITQLSNHIALVANEKPYLLEQLRAHEGWSQYIAQVLQPQNELENVNRWTCGRPTATELGGLDSDDGEYPNDMELETVQPDMDPPMYHRYGILDEDDGEVDQESNRLLGPSAFENSTLVDAFENTTLVNAMSAITLERLPGQRGGSSDNDDEDEEDDSRIWHRQGLSASAEDRSHNTRGEDDMDADEVVLESSDDEDIPTDSQVEGEGGPTFAQKESPDDDDAIQNEMVVVEEDVAVANHNSVDDEVNAFSDATYWKPDFHTQQAVPEDA